MVHHRYSISSLRSLEKCPNFRRVPSAANVKNAAAEEGTMLHNRVEAEAATPELTREQSEMVEGVLEIMRPTKMAAVKVEKEVQVNIERPDGTLLTAGHIDIIVWASATKALVTDFKFGRVEVDSSATNVQLAGYALGVFQRDAAVEEVTVQIIQPRVSWEIVPQTYYRKDVAALYARVAAIVDNAEAAESGADLQKLDRETCSYCRFAATCPETAEFMSTIMENHVLAWPKNLRTPENREMAMDCIGLIQAVIASTKAECILSAEAGESCGQYALTNRKTADSLSDEDFHTLLKVAVGDAAFVALTPLLPSLSISPAKLPRETFIALKSSEAIIPGHTTTYLKRKGKKQ